MQTFYVNTGYDNNVTLDVTMDSEINDFGCLTWRELLTEVLGEDLGYLMQDDKLLDHYGIESSELDRDLNTPEVGRYYSQISFHVDNRSGAEAHAFEFIESLQLFPTDKDGNGAAHGVALEQSYANGPRKFVTIADESAANWLVNECAKRGVAVVVEFVGAN